MSRQDIDMNASLGEMNTTDNLSGRYFCDFLLLEAQAGEDNDHALYGEVRLTSSLASRVREGVPIHVRIPYVADSRNLLVCLRTDYGSGEPEYLPNPQTNRRWYTVVWEDKGSLIPVNMSEIWGCNADGNFTFVVQGGMLALYSGSDTDLMIRPALKQNETFLLKAAAGNLYQHPTTGVGLIDFLHGNFENSNLAAKLQSEFEGDGMIIHNAYMNSQTGELLLDVTERNG